MPCLKERFSAGDADEAALDRWLVAALHATRLDDVLDDLNA